MNQRKCKRCLWWDALHERVKAAPPIPGIASPGLCRKHKPGSERVQQGYYLGVQPMMDADDYCGEFREEAK